jgi:mRNA-degrading endonuclease YafQ of YafQ-DinJ toxin-antitoxin module
MRYHELLLEKKKKQLAVMYHGTSDVFLQSILKNGLKANPNKRTYDSNTLPNQDRGYDTFKGAVYLSKSIDVAHDGMIRAVDVHGGHGMVIKVQYVIGSEETDEDSITTLLQFKFNLISDDMTVLEFLEFNTQRRNYATNVDKMVKIIQPSTNFREVNHQAKTLIKQLYDYILMSTNYIYQNQSKYQDILMRIDLGDTPMRNYITDTFLEINRHNPVFESIMSRLMRQLSPSGNSTIRIARDIGFSGDTKIIEIRDYDEGLLYPQSQKQSVQEYSQQELSEFTLMEAAGDWQVQQSTAFKKGFKKHRNDKRTIQAFKDVMEFVQSYDRIPPMADYPIEFNAHPIKKDAKFAGTTWVHLKGQKLGLLFKVQVGKPNTIQLIHLGTHQEIGWS